MDEFGRPGPGLMARSFDVSLQSGSQQFAGDRHSDRLGLSFDAGLSGVGSDRGRDRLQQSALRLALVPDHRRSSFFRLRPDLRLAGRLLDGADVPSVRSVRLAEPDAQDKLGIFARPYASARVT